MAETCSSVAYYAVKNASLVKPVYYFGCIDSVCQKVFSSI
jgi:hypothetical protein